MLPHHLLLVLCQENRTSRRIPSNRDPIARQKITKDGRAQASTRQLKWSKYAVHASSSAALRHSDVSAKNADTTSEQREELSYPSYNNDDARPQRIPEQQFHRYRRCCCCLLLEPTLICEAPDTTCTAVTTTTRYHNASPSQPHK